MSDQNNNSFGPLRGRWQELRGKWKGIAGGVFLSVGLGYLLLTTPVGFGLTAASYDLPFAVRPWTIPHEAVMVYLDDASYDHLHQKYLIPWDRAYFTKFLKRMTAEGAKAVVFDIIFSDLLDTNTDQHFADAIAENGNVILTRDWTIQEYGKNGKPAGKGFTKIPFLFESRAADVGATTLFPDAGEYVRQYPAMILDGKDKTAYGTEAWVTVLLLRPSFHESPLTNAILWLNYYAPEDAMPTVSFYKTISDHDPDVPPGFFKDKVVFLGAKLQTHLAAERKDEYSTPFSYRGEDKWTSGAMIHETALLNILRGDYLRRVSYITERTAIILLGIFFGTMFVVCRPFAATLIALLSCVPVTLADYYLFNWHYMWFPWLIIVAAQIPIALIWGVSYNSLQLYAEKVRVEQSLSLYLSPKLVKKFARDPSLLKPGAVKHQLTILFTDIAGFTSISEGMDPDELARLMNAYFQTAVQNCIHATDGTIVKYIGDAIFAFWNAPELQADHAYLACDAALRFRDLKAQKVNGRELITRIGLHTGVANVGNFGSDARVDYTAIGENINLASRMEGLNKYTGTIVLLTADTQREIASRLVTRYLGLFRLKGFEKSVGVYELVGRPEQEADTRELRERFARALDAFAKRDFDHATEEFRKIIDTAPDGPSQFYLEQIEELRATELPADWKGEIVLKDK